jgi:hypothetical protein
MNICRHVKCSVMLSDFKQIWNASTFCGKTPQYQISQKPIEHPLDRWTWKNIRRILRISLLSGQK